MINLKTYEVLNAPSIEESVRLLRTQFRDNKERFRVRWLTPLETWLKMNEHKNTSKIIKMYDDLFDNYRSYNYEEAFSITNQQFRSLVFSVINVPEMIEHLGHKRISVEGIELKNKTWNPFRNEFEILDLTQVYELHEVDGTKLGIDEPLYAIKCWCTSTNTEHWLWTNKNTKPLDAIAETCWVYKPMLNKIKHIIRQGDVFLFEMNESVIISENDEKVPLDKKTYFNLLKSQS